MIYALQCVQNTTTRVISVLFVFSTGKINWIIRTADKDTIERVFIDFLGHYKNIGNFIFSPANYDSFVRKWTRYTSTCDEDWRLFKVENLFIVKE